MSNRDIEDPLVAKEYVHEENHIDAGEFLKSMVYGGLDGCINTLIIILSGISSSN